MAFENLAGIIQNKKQMAIEAKELEREHIQKQQEARQARINLNKESMEKMIQVLTESRKVGGSPEELAPVAAALRNTMVQNIQLGDAPEGAMSVLEQQIKLALSTPTAEETRQQEVDQKSAIAGAEAGAKEPFQGTPQPVTLFNRDTQEMVRGVFNPGTLVTTLENGEPAPDNFVRMGITTQATGEDVGLSSKTVGALEEDIINIDEGLQRARNIRQEFKPEFLETFTQLGAKGLAAAEKLGVSLSESQTKFLTDFSAFSRKVKEDLNATIKAITGAQMSTGEAERIEAQLATMGDSPTEFIAKLDDSIRSLEKAKIRAQILRNNGFSEKQISRFAENDNFPIQLDDTDKIVNDFYNKALEETGDVQQAIRKTEQEFNL